MQLELLNEEVHKIWRRHTPETPAGMLQMELDLHKKLLNFFQVGDYYYYIFNFQTLEFDLVSPGIQTVLGYQPSEMTIDFFMGIVHPDDIPWLVNFEDKTSNFLTQLPADKVMKYKNRYDYRLKKKNGNYIRILHQASIVQMDENGGLIRTLGVHTDISHLQREGKPVMSLIGMDDEPSYLDIDVKNPFKKTTEALSKREKEVLRLLIEGKVSKEIGDALNISKLTVDTHRRNMLRRNKLTNTGELVGKAIKEGWL